MSRLCSCRLLRPVTRESRCGRVRFIKMVRADFGGIEVGSGLDLHSLRHSHVTEVVRTGASISEVLRICRLSTPILLDRYYHSDAEDQEAIILKLPRTKLA